MYHSTLNSVLQEQQDVLDVPVAEHLYDGQGGKCRQTPMFQQLYPCKEANATHALCLLRDFKSPALLTEIMDPSPPSWHSRGHCKVETAAAQETQKSVGPIHASSMALKTTPKARLHSRVTRLTRSYPSTHQ